MRDDGVAAEDVRAAYGPPTEQDLADVGDGGALRRFAVDLGELLDQIAVAGLAHPDPDWAAAAAGLVERGRRLGLGAATHGLARLGDALVRVRDAAPPGVVAPAALTGDAWQATQRLVAWRRLFGRELAFQVAEGRLAADALVARGERPARPAAPTASARVRPLGLTLRDDRLTVLGVDVDRGTPVHIRDRLSDHDPDDPLGRPVISRLFQARIGLRAALDGLIVFERHPVGRARGGPAFGPAFRSVPRRLALAGQHIDPPLPRATDFEAIRGPVRAALRIERGLDGLVLRSADDPAGPEVEVERTPVFDLNLLGCLLMGDDGDRAARLDVVLGPGPAAPRALSADDGGERVFVAHDPRCFTLDPATLYRRACAARDVDPVDGRFVRTVAGLFGGAADGAVTAAGEQWRGPVPGVDRLFRAVLAGRLLGVAGDPALDGAVERAIDDTLLLAALPPDGVRLAELRALVGGPVSRGAGVPGRVVFRALWMAFVGGGARPRRGAMLTLFAARYAEPVGDPSAFDVAARALMLAELSRQAAEADEAHGEPAMAEDEVLAPAREYFEAHLADLRPTPGRPAAPLPEPGGLWALGAAHRLLYREGGLSAMGLHRPTLAAAVAGALLDLSRRPLPAADGLLCALDAGVADWVVGG